MHVAQPAPAALGDQQALPVRGQITNDFIGIDVVHHRPDRHLDEDILSALAVFLLAHAVLAALGAELALVAEINQGIEVFICGEPHAAAITAIAAIGAAERDELLAPKPHATIAAIACNDRDFGFIDQFHSKKPRSERGLMCARSGLRRRDHADGPLALGAFDREIHRAIDQRIERMVTAQAHARTRMELGAALAHDDVAGLDGLPAVDFHAQIFRIGIAAVA